MIHVKQIKEMMEEGKLVECEDAIENLLALGPQNIEALKLKAAICRHQGRFKEETALWEKIIEIDNEDLEAFYYFETKQLEARNHFYFTETLQGGIINYLSYPKELIRASLYGMLGCMTFWGLAGAARRVAGENFQLVVFLSLLVLVVLPIVLIVRVWAKTIHNVTISPQFLRFATRFKQHAYQWDDIEDLFLVHSMSTEDSSPSLLVIPKSSETPAVALNLRQDTTSIPARAHLVADIESFYREDILVKHWDDIDLKKRKIINF